MSIFSLGLGLALVAAAQADDVAVKRFSITGKGQKDYCTSKARSGIINYSYSPLLCFSDDAAEEAFKAAVEDANIKADDECTKLGGTLDKTEIKKPDLLPCSEGVRAQVGPGSAQSNRVFVCTFKHTYTCRGVKKPSPTARTGSSSGAESARERFERLQGTALNPPSATSNPPATSNTDVIEIPSGAGSAR